MTGANLQFLMFKYVNSSKEGLLLVFGLDTEGIFSQLHIYHWFAFQKAASYKVSPSRINFSYETLSCDPFCCSIMANCNFSSMCSIVKISIANDVLYHTLFWRSKNFHCLGCTAIVELFQVIILCDIHCNLWISLYTLLERSFNKN